MFDDVMKRELLNELNYYEYITPQTERCLI